MMLSREFSLKSLSLCFHGILRARTLINSFMPKTANATNKRAASEPLKQISRSAMNDIKLRHAAVE
jgi:hypothetical protein